MPNRMHIPRPSECFTSALEILRASHAPTGRNTPTMASRIPNGLDTIHTSVPYQTTTPREPTASSPMGIQTASATSLKKHAQKLRSMAQRMNRQRVEGALRHGFDIHHVPSTSALEDTHTDKSTNSWSWVPRLLRTWTRGGCDNSPTPTWWHEMDADIAWSLTHYLEHCLGIPANMLTDSVGLRTLLQRHLQWLQMTPEWMQLVGLLLAKRWRHRCGGLGDAGMPYLSVDTAAPVDNTVPPPVTEVPIDPPLPMIESSEVGLDPDVPSEPLPTVLVTDESPVETTVYVDHTSVRSVEVPTKIPPPSSKRSPKPRMKRPRPTLSIEDSTPVEAPEETPLPKKIRKSDIIKPRPKSNPRIPPVKKNHKIAENKMESDWTDLVDPAF